MGSGGIVSADVIPATGRHRADPLREYNEPMLPAEVAEVFGVTVKTVSRWAKEEKIGCIRTVGGHRRYPKEHVRAAMRLMAANQW